MKRLANIVLILCCTTQLFAQSENAGWVFISHKQSLSEKLDIRADFQLRSADKLSFLSGILLRGALSYNLNKQNSIALGYAYLGSWEYEQNIKISSGEQRIFEQYLNQHSFGKIEGNLRLRLEQRFMQEDGETNFSLRGRIFLSAQIPIFAIEDFSRGIYTGLQDEFFMNLQNKENVNESFFDQNRLFVSLGYRWNKKIDTEFGYMYWRQKEQAGIINRNIWQLMVTTSF
ncbi:MULTISPECIES: DUF2490 domain-containing protein [unclassified Pedobacter]|uniref:DUF2490 domain-containing protein n=1 Tax=unclassified Pedobacter TaxID=2628915 RepID=UPI001E4D6E88|nr:MULTISPECIES: DUF2490 domain-containing protein [unclassified Pedobacter]